jgi:hypothetical protein
LRRRRRPRPWRRLGGGDSASAVSTDAIPSRAETPAAKRTKAMGRRVRRRRFGDVMMRFCGWNMEKKRTVVSGEIVD